MGQSDDLRYLRQVAVYSDLYGLGRIGRASSHFCFPPKLHHSNFQLERSHQPNFFSHLSRSPLHLRLCGRPFSPRLHSSPTLFFSLPYDPIQFSQQDLRFRLAPNSHLDSSSHHFREELTPRRRKCLPRKQSRKRRSIWVGQETI